MTALPKPLADDLARVRLALHSPQAGPDVLSARESLDRIEAALRGSQELRKATLALGVVLREYLDRGPLTRSGEVLLERMCDAEERATRG